MNRLMTCMSIVLIVLLTGVVSAATTGGPIDAITHTKWVLDSVTVGGTVYDDPNDFVAMKPTSLPDTLARVMVAAGQTKPATNQGVWDVASDRDLTTGYQLLKTPGAVSPAGTTIDFHLDSPIVTQSGPDVVFLTEHTTSAYIYCAIDADGNPIAGTEVTGDFDTPDPGFGKSMARDFYTVNSQPDGPSGAPVYGNFSPNVVPLVMRGLALNFDPGLTIYGVRMVLPGNCNACCLTEVFAIPATPLIPDNFEAYDETHDSTSFGAIWSSTSGTIDLVNSPVNNGNWAMRAVNAGTITKQVDYLLDCTHFDGMDVELWFKGQAGNTAGDITLAVLDPNDNLLGSGTFVSGTTQTIWTPVTVPIDVSNKPKWDRASKLQITVGGSGTVYFDDLSIVIPELPTTKVVEWKFNESDGTVASDSSGNNINGTLGSGVTNDDWIVNGGHTGLAGDNALRLDPAEPNNFVVAVADLTGLDIRDIFKAASSWTINMWVFLYKPSVFEAIGGFGDSYSGMTPGSGRQIYTDGSGRPFSWNGASGNNVYTTTALSVNTWQMLTVTHERWTAETNVYLNGMLMGTGTQLGMVDATTNTIKIYPTLGTTGNYSSGFSGLVDDFAIWDGALSWQEVIDVYGSPVCQPGTEPTYDLNRDCVVNMDDFAMLASEWLIDMRLFPAL